MTLMNAFDLKDPDLPSRFRACLLGGAAGDALGGIVEFLTLRQIRAAYGAAGIRNYGATDSAMGCITDDTQMTLYTAAALLESEIRAPGAFVREERLFGRFLVSAYLHWLATQGVSGRVEPDYERISELAAWPGMSDQRAPGHTCLSALAELPILEWAVAPNDRKGCGGVMRIAPLGLAAVGTDSPAALAFNWGMRAAAVTHGHPTGYLAAGATAAIIAELARHGSLQKALAAAETCLVMYPEAGETLSALRRARELAAEGAACAEQVERLGGGWVAEETLAIAVYCALVAADFEAGVLLATNHSGDSDSTASVAGQFLGLMHGLRSIPPRWLTTLESRVHIEGTADALARLVARRGGAPHERKEYE